MSTTIPQTTTEPRTARDRQCPLCPAAAGTPCQAKPPADHLARYLDAYTAGKLTREYLVMVLGGLVVIHHAAMVPDGAL
jgi:hypothetical protein